MCSPLTPHPFADWRLHVAHWVRSSRSTRPSGAQRSRAGLHMFDENYAVSLVFVPLGWKVPFSLIIFKISITSWFLFFLVGVY